jgi:hypothetical protein
MRLIRALLALWTLALHAEPTYRNGVPHITFEADYPGQERSCSFHLDIPEPAPHLRICYINGVKNQFKDAVRSAQLISQASGGKNVHGIYNASQGFMADFSEYRWGVSGVATEPATLLLDLLERLAVEMGPYGRILLYCHSQGAVHTHNALRSLAPEVRRQVTVVAIASPIHIPSDLCARTVHYCSKNDPVSRSLVKKRWRHEESIIVLMPHAQARFWDHTFDSPTFTEAIQVEMREFLAHQGAVK